MARLARPQPIPDSPTEKYYTDWRVFERALGSPPARNLEPPPRLPEGWCLADPATREGWCSAVLPSKDDLEFPRLGEELLSIHIDRSSAPLLVEPKQESTVLVPLRAGDGYLGYNVIVRAPASRASKVVIADTALVAGGLKTQYIEVRVEEEAILDLSHLVVHESQPVYTIVNVSLERGARLIYRLAGHPGPMTRHRLSSALEGEESRLDVLAGIVSGGKSQGDFILGAEHRARLTVSLVKGRGLAMGDSRLVLRGTARVLGVAAFSSTRVEMHVLLAGDRAKGRSVPMLEIHTGEVSEASHSAAVTSIGEDAVFYAATRGLSREELESLVAYGIIEATGSPQAAEELGLELLPRGRI